MTKKNSDIELLTFNVESDEKIENNKLKKVNNDFAKDLNNSNGEKIIYKLNMEYYLIILFTIIVISLLVIMIINKK